MRTTINKSRALPAVAALGVALAGCSAVQGSESDVVDYWLWDANQLPAYQECAEAFQAESGTEVRISQYGWDDYWNKLTAALVAGAGPDVFTDHVARYPEYVTRGALLDLETQPATRDIDASEFHEGLADMWVGPDGGTYGVPKDFDTIALFYDKNLVEEAGLTEEDMQNLTWNPEDGGTYEDVIAHLTVDENGVRGDEEGFDPDNVATYGLGSNGSGSYQGQTEWSHYAYSTGWHHTDEELWATEYQFDEPEIQDTLGWYFGLVDKGYMPPYEMVGEAPDTAQQLGTGQAAIIPNGSWMIRTFASLEGIDLGIATLPAGPVGHPVSMYNGLGDSINAQTDNSAAAAQWVAFLGSDACQTIVGEHAIVFPARPAGTDAAIEAFAEQGIDVTPFTDLVDKGWTSLYPLASHGSRVESIMGPVMDGIYLGQRDVSTLTEVNERVNALFEND
ncbi:sugar ABC transporter substrate-binding protein [Georgenia halophila]|uniref:Sugar ABC transporter substrate-binding protein n=1 Tax=Georgenia halophila TaxID=620889 RepID=A0ABP8LDZ0_9MICO